MYVVRYQACFCLLPFIDESDFSQMPPKIRRGEGSWDE